MTTPKFLVRSPQPPVTLTRMLGLIALCAVSTTALAQVTPTPRAVAPAAVGATHAYDIPLFKDGASFAQPSNQWSYFFELRPNVMLVGDQYVQLNFVGSPLLKKTDGAMSILLNGVNVDSRTLGGTAAGQLVQWHVNLPLKYFKLSDFNELRIVSRQRTMEGPCKDMDNSADWIRFAQGCRLHLVRKDPMVYPLNSYPFPYLDNLAVGLNNVVKSNWELAGGAAPGSLGEALGLASDWGANSANMTRGLNIHLTGGGAHAGNTISIGGPTSANGAGGSIEASPGGRPGNATLNIGGSPDGIRMARQALANAASVELMKGTSAIIDHAVELPAKKPTTQLGVFTLAQLGTPYVHLAGAFHQRQTIYIQRPIRTDLGRESTLTIKFKHSASLNPLRSILSAYINGIPIGSARLDADNANAGEFTARIPVSELEKNLWVLDLEAYHDLAAVDCSRTYDEVAWTFVDGSSFFDLRSGALAGVPYLDAFPYLVDGTGLAPTRVPISLSANPSDAEMSAAAVIAARAGQVNRQSFDWDVTLGGLPNSKGSAIIIGTFDEASRFAPIAGQLLVVPKGGGQFAIDKRMGIQSSELGGGVILQAIPTAGGTGVTYVLLGASDYAIQRFADSLADPTKSLKVSGEVSAMSSDGKAISTYTTTTPGAVNENVSVESNRYTPLMTGVIIVIVIALVLLFLWVISQFRRRPARR